MGHKFILLIILSLGIFGNEVDLTMHRTLHNDLHDDKLIKTDDKKDSLKHHSKYLLRLFIEEQLVNLPKVSEK